MKLLRRGKERTHTPKTQSVFLFVRAAFFFSVCFVNAALAAPDTNIYGNRVLSGTDPIYLIVPDDGSLTQVASSLFPSAALARSPSTGLLYYTQYNVTDSQVATWNPDTGIHTVIGNLGAGVGALARLAFRANRLSTQTPTSCRTR